ncbi:toll-like receptor 4 [Patella vulgata]|uniref:toll-like receptor 4 n=1 Tax=Patella vulgata TaxID=6465 RepID=UPI0024A98A60|nr:toll-like receptor 4 [Patella vulgata]
MVYQIIGVILALSFTLSPLGANKKCLEKVDVQYGGFHANCSHIKTSRVPEDLPDNTTTLDLTFNNIKTLYNNDFKYLTQLRYLDVSFNPIDTLQEFSFHGLGSLLVLEFNGHNLNYTEMSMPLEVFTPLKSLTNLSLRSDISRFPNRQFIIPDRVVGSLTKLKQLNIDMSSDFHSGFSNLTELKELIVGGFWKHGKWFQCELFLLTKTTFRVFSNIPVQLIQLNSCIIKSFDEDFLRPFPNLKTLLLNNITMKNGNLSRVIQVLHVFEYKNMTEISINRIITFLPYIGFNRRLDLQSLSKICLEKLDLSQNLINIVDFDVFFTAPYPPLTRCIRRFNVSGNRITGTISLHLAPLIFAATSLLEEADLSDQRKFSFNKYIIRATPSDAHRKFPEPIPIFISRKLRYLNVAGLPHEIGELEVDVEFIFANNLEYLNMSYCGLYNAKRKVFGLGNLDILDISGNSLRIINVTFFDEFPNLRTLRVSNALLDNDFLAQNGRRFFSPLKKLENLDLSSNGLVYLPNDLFNSMVTLKVLNLANNNLITIPDVTQLVKLNSLYLNHNAITTLSHQTRDMLEKTNENNKKFKLHLWGNTFTCTCEEIPFLRWVEETDVDLDGSDYSCVESSGILTFTKAVYNQWTTFNRNCVSSFLLNLTIGGFGIITLTLIVAFVFIKNKMKLKLLLLRMIGKNIYPKKRDDFVYDAFIIYTDSISGWVCNELRNELETNRGIKLNLRDRDHIPGGSQADDLLEAIRDSWKIVLILTEEFLRSDLAYFAMCNCLSSVTLTTPQRLIVLIDHQTNITANLDFLLEAVNEDSILYVDLQHPLTIAFWDRISNVIKSKEGINI